MYENCLKRCLDCFLGCIALVVLSPVMLVLTVLGAVIMRGNPFFTQKRPGKDEKIFRLIKFRTMTNARDKDGKLLPDDKRLTPYGRFIRSTSLDELPELFNIIIGEMAVVGPRPLLVSDMLFMTDEQRRRHTVRPGLTGLAQCNGRNNMLWEQKFEYDLEYIKNITFFCDALIILKTVFKVFARDGITEEGMATGADLGDYLLEKGAINPDYYNKKQEESRLLLMK